MKVIKNSPITLAGFLFACLMLFSISCSVVNSNYKIVGKYVLYIDNPNAKKETGFGNFIGRKLLNSLFHTDVEFFANGKTDIKFSMLDILISDRKEGGVTFEVKGSNLILKSDDGDESIFEMTKTEEGFKLKNEEITFHLKKN